MREVTTTNAQASNAVVPFAFEGAEIRIVMMDGEPFFVGKDVAERLGYVDPTSAMKQHCKGVVKRHPLQTAGGVQKMRVLAEPDVLRLIVSSNLPAAERFERWVFEEALPTIRRTGGYGLVPKPNSRPRSPRLRGFDKTFEGLHRLATRFYKLDDAQATIHAGHGTELLHGINPGTVMRIARLESPAQEMFFTVTQLAQRQGYQSNQWLNKAFLAMGLHEKTGNDDCPYVPTDAGRPYSRLEDSPIKGRRSRQMLLWSLDVVPLIETYLASTAMPYAAVALAADADLVPQGGLL